MAEEVTPHEGFWRVVLTCQFCSRRESVAVDIGEPPTVFGFVIPGALPQPHQIAEILDNLGWGVISMSPFSEQAAIACDQCMPSELRKMLEPPKEKTDDR
jgi:hypothetical protein